MRIRGWAVTGLGLLVPLLAACGPSATTPGSAYGSGSTSASPMTSASSGSAVSTGASGTSAGMTRTVTLTIKTTKIGKVLADAKGDTLYWYSKDMEERPVDLHGRMPFRVAGRRGQARGGDGHCVRLASSARSRTRAARSRPLTTDIRSTPTPATWRRGRPRATASAVSGT